MWLKVSDLGFRVQALGRIWFGVNGSGLLLRVGSIARSQIL